MAPLRWSAVLRSSYCSAAIWSRVTASIPSWPRPIRAPRSNSASRRRHQIAARAPRLVPSAQEHWGHRDLFELIAVPGNHGRSTFGKPRAKLASRQSYDTLVADFVELRSALHGEFSFYTPRNHSTRTSTSAGWPTILTHGDRMSAGGGTGFIGPAAANIVKGHKKLMLTEAQQRRPVGSSSADTSIPGSSRPGASATERSLGSASSPRRSELTQKQRRRTLSSSTNVTVCCASSRSSSAGRTKVRSYSPNGVLPPPTISIAYMRPLRSAGIRADVQLPRPRPLI